MKTNSYKRLNETQLKILELIYLFRFINAKSLVIYFHSKDLRSLQRQLKLLEDRMLISKRYDPSYKLRGRAAAYFLLPTGLRALFKEARTLGELPDIKNIYKDKNTSEAFIDHQIHTFELFAALHHSGLDTFSYHTKNDLRRSEIDELPNPLPDALITLHPDSTHFLLDLFDAAQPFFVMIRRIKKYLAYSLDTDSIPIVLMVCEDGAKHQKLRKRISKELRNTDSGMLHFATTTLHDSIATPNNKVWLPIDPYDETSTPPNPADLRELQSLFSASVTDMI